MSQKRGTSALLAAVLLLSSAGSVWAAQEENGYRSPADSQGRDVSRYPADNTGKNVRDRRDATLTPEDQSENKDDRKMTQRLRRAIQKDKGLSLNAKNVKIITVGGTITLRGPVASEEEKIRIGETARQIAGAENVNDQLEVAP